MSGKALLLFFVDIISSRKGEHMKRAEQFHGAAGLKIIVGVAFFYAWLDALFMNVFFMRSEFASSIAEVAFILVFLLSTPGLLLAMVRRPAIERLLLNRKALFTFAVLGSIGSLLIIFSGITFNWMLLALGTVCGGLFFSVYQLGWGASFCFEGEKTATPYVAGGFACAVAVDTPLLFMIPEASAVFFALLPVASGLFFISVDPIQRSYRKAQLNNVRVLGPRSRLRSYLGVSFMLLSAVVFVMLGFGYMQHLVSFSPFVTGVMAGGVVIQVARGIAAILMFVVIVVLSGRASIVYRVGLLAMIAGFILMPLLFGSDLFWLAGAILIGGYTAFDLLVWVTFSQIAYTQSRCPLSTIAFVRLIAVFCCAAGGIISIVFVDVGDQSYRFITTGTTIVGYLVVIATVLVLSSEDIGALFGRSLAHTGSVNGDERANPEERLGAWLEEFGLTARQKEIATLLACGRTQPWIAGSLMISENTVGTHVRHIYQKLDVHSRQEFIDLAFSVPSPESRDAKMPSPKTPDIEE
jgi:DNA-binding CsgD family transcriptional regulator